MNSFNERVCQLFSSRFKTQLKIRWSIPVVDSIRLEKKWKTTFVYSVSSKQVAFPIFNGQQKLRAIAIAGPVENEDVIRFQEMSDFIQLTLVKSVELKEQRDQLIKKEFICTPQYKGAIVKYPSKEGQEMSPKNSRFQKPSTAIWLVGNDPKLNLKVAYSIHEWKRNWALINIREIPDLFWTEKDDWSIYRQMSLLLPAAEDLLDSQWIEMHENINRFKNMDPNEQPTLMLTSQLDPALLNPEVAQSFLIRRVYESVSPQLQAHFLLYQNTENPLAITQDQNLLESLIFLPSDSKQSTFH